MNLQLDTITLSYIDEEKDQIVIGSDDDLSVMVALNAKKPYTKVIVEGKIQDNKEVVQMNTV
jgi:hypothetical protein